MLRLYSTPYNLLLLPKVIMISTTCVSNSRIAFTDHFYLQFFDHLQYAEIEGEGLGDLVTCDDVG